MPENNYCEEHQRPLEWIETALGEWELNCPQCIHEDAEHMFDGQPNPYIRQFGKVVCCGKHNIQGNQVHFTCADGSDGFVWLCAFCPEPLDLECNFPWGDMEVERRVILDDGSEYWIKRPEVTK